MTRLTPELRCKIHALVRSSGMHCGTPSDKTTMNRFYQAKEKLREQHEELHKLYSDGYYENPSPLDIIKLHLKEAEEIEHIMFEDEFLR